MKSEEDKEKVLNEFKFLTLDEDGKIMSRILANDRGLVQSLINEPERSICVKKLPDDWDHDTLYNEFSKYGNITCSKVSKTFKIISENQTEVKSNNYGFVAFDSAEEAKKALEDSKSEVYDVEPYEKKVKVATIMNNLYVKNIPKNWTEEYLGKEFQKFGELGSFTIMRDDSNESKGFGFVCFTKPDDAQSAIKAMHGMKIDGQPEPFYVQYAIKKEQRMKALKKSLQR